MFHEETKISPEKSVTTRDEFVAATNGEQTIVTTNIVATTGSPSVTTTARKVIYGDTANVGSAGRTKSIQHQDGSWTFYTYDSTGRVFEEYSSWLSLPPPDQNNPNNPGWPYPPSSPLEMTDYPHRKTTYTYAMEDDFRATEIKDYFYDFSGQNYILTSKTTNDYEAVNGQPPKKTEKRHYTDSVGQSQFLQTIREYDGLGVEAKPTKITYPDGRVDTYTYGWGSYVDDGDPEDAHFELQQGFGEFQQTTIVHGTTAHPDGVPSKSTREIEITDQAGRTVLEETYVCNDSAEYEPIDWTVQRYDANGHLEHRYRSNGDHFSQFWDCCKVEWSIDEDGIKTIYTYDPFGRLETSKKEGVDPGGTYLAQEDITTTYGYDFADRVTMTKRESGSLSLESSRKYDGLGQVIEEKDEAGIVTTYVHNNPGAADGIYRTVQTNVPGGHYSFTHYYRDGRIHSIEGSAVPAEQHYFYGVEADGTQWTKVVTGPVGTSAPERYVKTWTDLLGRTLKQERPGFDPDGAAATVTKEYHYNNLGQLDSIESNATGPDQLHANGRGGPPGSYIPAEDPGEGGGSGGGTTITTLPDGATKIFEYDVMGNLKRSGIEMDDTADSTPYQLDLASKDRINDVETKYVKTGETWWLETINKVYPAVDADTVVETGKNREHLTNLPSESIC